jgi:exonuclease III
VLAGDYNVMPTELDVFAPERWVDDALFRPEVREAFRRLTGQGLDPLRALHHYPPALLRSWASQSVGFPTETQGAKAFAYLAYSPLPRRNFAVYLSGYLMGENDVGFFEA